MHLICHASTLYNIDDAHWRASDDVHWRASILTCIEAATAHKIDAWQRTCDACQCGDALHDSVYIRCRASTLPGIYAALHLGLIIQMMHTGAHHMQHVFNGPSAPPVLSGVSRW